MQPHPAWRQRAWPEWNKRVANSPEAKANNQAVPIVACGTLYALMCSPALWALRGASVTDASTVALVGVAVQWFGLVLEAVADTTKARHKMASADAGYCSSGVYSVVRHPNYTGEILAWVGVFLAGLPAMVSLGGGAVGVVARVLPAALGLAGIVGLMLRVTPKLDAKQADKYGDDLQYASYVQRTKMLLPGIY